jgi:hypothetical protein
LLAINTTTLPAATYCAKSAFELDADLADVSTGGVANGGDNTIHVASGNYVAAVSAFSYSDASGHALIIDGGYDATCATQDQSPGKTQLDGNNAWQAISVVTNGTITLRHLTFQNGLHNGSSNGGGVGIILNRAKTTDPVPAADFDDNLVRNNNTDEAAAGVSIFATAPDPDTPVGKARVADSVFTGNTAPSASALFIDLGPGSAAYVTNDTFARNTCTSPSPTATVALGDNAGALDGYVTNSISYGNTATEDFYVYINESVRFTDNDYTLIVGTPNPLSSGNLIAVDPKFVDSAGGDFRLSAASPLFARGTAAAPGALPPTDIAGHSNPGAGRIDLGAFQDTVFSDGLETQ